MSSLGEMYRSADPPLYIVTTASPTERSGCLVGFATQCSIEPERLLIGLSVLNHTYRVARAASHLAVHLLAESDRALAHLFAEESGDEVDKFVDLELRDVIEGVPVLEAGGPWVLGRIIDHVALGDHVGFVIEPISHGGVACEALRPSAIHLVAAHPPTERSDRSAG